MLSVLNYRFSCPPDVTQKIKTAQKNGQLEAVVSSLPEGICVEKDAHLFGDENLSNLHISAKEGDYKTAYLLLRLGADVDAVSLYKETALHLAIKAGNTDLVKLLVDSGASNIQNRDGWTALHMAVQVGSADSVKLLLNSGASNIQDKGGWTALHLAVKASRSDLVKLLLDSGVQINIQDKEGWTALHLAVQAGSADSVKLLLNSGASNIQDKDGGTALHLAVQAGKADFVKLLLCNGAQINIQDKDGWTPLHLATKLKQADFVKLLLDSGAQINIQDKDGWTPLHFAAYSHITPIVAELLARDADATIKTRSENTALSLASLIRERRNSEEFLGRVLTVALSAAMIMATTMVMPQQNPDEFLVGFYEAFGLLVLVTLAIGALFNIIYDYLIHDPVEELIEKHIKDQLTATELYTAKDGLSSPALVDHCQEIQCKNTPPQPLSTVDKITIVVNTSSACIVVPQSYHRDFLNCAIETGALPASGNLWHEASSAHFNASLLDNHSGQIIVEVVGALLLCLPAA